MPLLVARQVLGDTQAAYNLTPDDVMVTGKNGMMVRHSAFRCPFELQHTDSYSCSRDYP